MYNTFLAYILWFFSGCGALGLHRFYLGKIPSGVLWLCTGGLCAVGSIYDLITMQDQVREANIRKVIIDDNEFRNQTKYVSGRQPMRTVNDGQARIVREKEPVERVILKLAKTNKGVLNASDLALAANISMEEAKRDLDAMVNKGFAELRVRQSGTLAYTIPDFMDDNNEPFVD